MRVALVHDWLTGMRGGERVLERLCLMFPDAPIFTLLWTPGSVSRIIESHPIHVSFIQHLPMSRTHYRWYLPLFPRAISGFSLRGFDLVVSSSHCAAKAVPVAPGIPHLSYIHTPMRYIWELEDEYFPEGRFPGPLSWYVRRTCAWLRTWDVETSRQPDALIANSAHVASRIARHYGRRAEIIHPRVDTRRLAPGSEKRDVYLVAGAFAPYKRTDLAIRACQRLGRQVVVVGGGQEAERLARMNTGATFLGWVDDDRLAQLYRRAKALLFPGEEDFGMVPVEALASGCPVIAYGRGGALETVGRGADRKTLAAVEAGGTATVPGGVLFGTQTVEALCEAIEQFEREQFDPQSLSAMAEPFSSGRFERSMTAAIDRLLAGQEAPAAAQEQESVA